MTKRKKCRVALTEIEIVQYRDAPSNKPSHFNEIHK